MDRRSPSHRGLLSVNSISHLSILSMLEYSLFIFDQIVSIVDYPFLQENLFSLGFHYTTLL